MANTTSAPASTAATPVAAPRRSWLEAARVYAQPQVLQLLLLGFSAGLPLLLVLGTLSFRLREAGIDRTTIGYLSWVGLVYGFKWLWAPLVDRVRLPLLTRALGQRRSWLLLAQCAIAAGLVGMALTDPLHALDAITWFALVVAFASATQDIALDAYRIESAPADQQAALAAAYQTGYRFAMIWAGAGVLWIAARTALGPGYQHGAWQVAYLVMGASMSVGVLTTLLVREPLPRDASAERAERAALATRFARDGLVFAWPLAVSLLGVAGLLWVMLRASLGTATTLEVVLALLVAGTGFIGLDRGWGQMRKLQLPIPPALAPPLAWLYAAAYQPFADFVRRYRRQALLILALIAVYRISDVVMGIMANPFYVDMGYSKDDVAQVAKLYGVAMTLAGAFFGGLLAARFGVLRILFLGAVLSAVSNLLFAWLNVHGHYALGLGDYWALVLVISADNLSSGIASAAFIAYLSSLTNVTYSATQYALFSSVMLLLPKWLAGFSGAFVDVHGYASFFVSTALLGVPVVLLVWLAARSARSNSL